MIMNILHRVAQNERINEEVEMVRRAVEDIGFEQRVDEDEATHLYETNLARTEGTMFLSSNQGE
jgi:hypothetical protein